jgi:hypothetical protein
MNGKNGEPRVKPITSYLKESIRFYDLDKPALARMVFLLELAVLFVGYLVIRPYTLSFFKYGQPIAKQLESDWSFETLSRIMDSTEYANMVSSLVSIAVITLAMWAVSFLITGFFCAYYFLQLTNPQMSAGSRVSLFFQRLPKIILFNILFYIAFYIGAGVIMLLARIIAGIIPFIEMFIPLAILALGTLFVFKDLLIVEFNVGIFLNFKKTIELTESGRKNVVANMMWPAAISWLLNYLAMYSCNSVLSVFICAFLEVIVLLIGQRLTALMFIDAASLPRQGRTDKAADLTA